MALWSAKKPTTHTNAPQHWPKIELEHCDTPGMRLMLVGAQLVSLNKPPTSVVAFMQDFLYEDGILRVPIVVEERGRKTCVFVYSNQDQNAAAHYSGVRALLRTRENAAAVYYGPEPLLPSKGSDVLQPIDTPFFSKAPLLEQADFALWWATEDGPRLADSEERVLIDRWFEALDGYGFLLFGAFLKDLGLVKRERVHYALPAQALLQPLVGPGGTRMLLHASEREGLFLACDESTPVERRRVLLRLLADFAVQYRKLIEAKAIPPEAGEKGRGLECWRAIRDAALAKEAAGGAGLKLHTVTVKGGQASRSPSATTADERAAKPETPGREELDFALDLLDRVLAQLKRRTVKGSTQTSLGGPNFAPVIAAKVGPDVFERRCPLETMPTVYQAAGRALDEWPAAEIVAVIADGAIREDGRRTDILDVKVENRAARRAAAVFQRYQVASDGRVELIGRPTATPAERFLADEISPREPAPDEGLTGLARQALDHITALLNVGPSARRDDDLERTVLSPTALLGISGDSRETTVVLALQGPLTASATCYRIVQEKPTDWVVYHFDDLVSRNGTPERRFRLCVQRRSDAAMAIFDQRYEGPGAGRPFACTGELEFRRWSGSMFPPSA